MLTSVQHFCGSDMHVLKTTVTRVSVYEKSLTGVRRNFSRIAIFLELLSLFLCPIAAFTTNSRGFLLGGFAKAKTVNGVRSLKPVLHFCATEKYPDTLNQEFAAQNTVSNPEEQRMRKNFLKVYRDLFEFYCRFGIQSAAARRHMVYLEGMSFLTMTEALEGIFNMCRLDYLRTLSPDDPIRTADKLMSAVEISPERREELQQVASAIEADLVPYSGMPIHEAYITFMKLSYELPAVSSLPNFFERRSYLNKLRKRKSRYRNGARNGELAVYEKLIAYLFRYCAPTFNVDDF